MTNHLQRPARRGLRPLPLALAAAAALLAAGCDSLLDVEDPDVVKPPVLDSPEGLPVSIGRALADFGIAYNGPINLSLVSAQGIFTDEYLSSDTFEDRVALDKRDVDRNDNQAASYLFGNLHLARSSAVFAAERIREHDPENASLPLVLALAGYAETFLAETYCSGVPESGLEGNRIVYGAPRTTAQVFEAAAARFGEALAADPASSLAAVGRGRALLGLGRHAQAAEAVRGVPTGFAAQVEYSDNSGIQNNGLWTFSTNGRLTVWDREGGNGLPFRSAGDPRIRFEDTGDLGWDDQVPLYLQQVAPRIDSDMVYASGVEARLIEAEALLAGGQSAAYLPVLNALRAGVGLAPLSDPGTAAARVDQLFRERAFWLFSTAHRLGDLRRLVRQYGRGAESVFPSGPYLKGGSYGDDVSLPIPVEEDNNPLVAELRTGCIDRGA